MRRFVLAGAESEPEATVGKFYKQTALAGCPRYVVARQPQGGVIRPDLQAPELNPVYAAMLVANACRVRDPHTVEQRTWGQVLT